MVQFSDIIAETDDRAHECKQGVPPFDQHDVSRLLAGREGELASATFWNGLQALEPAAVGSGEVGKLTSVSVREAGGNCGEDEDLINGLALQGEERDSAAAEVAVAGDAGGRGNGHPDSFLDVSGLSGAWPVLVTAGTVALNF
jgi:hypothetical protein